MYLTPGSYKEGSDFVMLYGCFCEKDSGYTSISMFVDGTWTRCAVNPRLTGHEL